MQKPKLTFYTNIPTPYQLDFFQALSKRFQLRVVYYSNTEAGRQWDYNQDFDYEVITLKNNGIARLVQNYIIDFHYSSEIRKIVKEDDSENIIVGGSYWIPNALIIMKEAKKKGKKIAYFSEPLFESNNSLKNAVKKALVSNMAEKCDFLFCIGKKSIDSFNKYVPELPKYNVPYNIDISLFSEENLDKQKLTALTKKLKPNDEVVFLTSGALSHRKGIDILIKAMKNVKHSNVKLYILGDGALKEELVALNEGDERVVFAGFQQKEDIPYYFNVADVFIFASRYDGWAVVINEAMAAGIPIVSSDAVGAAIDKIENNKNGIICKSENVTEFSNAINQLADNKSERDRLKENADKIVVELSSDYNAAKVYDTFYRYS